MEVDLANIRLLDGGAFYLVAASGCSSTEIRKRAFNPIPLELAARTLASGAHDELARSLGIPSVRVVWMKHEGEPVGAIAVGARTKRRLSQDGLDYLQAIAAALAKRVAGLDRSIAARSAESIRLARRHEAPPWPSEHERVRHLRPRERNVLELYAAAATAA